MTRVRHVVLLALAVAVPAAPARAADTPGPAAVAPTSAPPPAAATSPETPPASPAEDSAHGATAPALVAPPTATPAPPEPMSPGARAHYEEGLRLYGDRNYAGAIGEFQAGFALDPRREFLFGEAQAYRLAGDCARAIPLYERFLGSGPSALQVDATRLALDRCARRPPRLAQDAPAPAPRAPAPALERPPWWHDPWALGALGAGLAAAGVGVGFIVASNSAADQANGAAITHYADFDRLWQTAERRRAIGVASLAAGGALLAAGVVRFALVRRHAAEGRADAGRAPRAPALDLALIPRAGGATVLGLVTY